MNIYFLFKNSLLLLVFVLFLPHSYCQYPFNNINPENCFDFGNSFVISQMIEEIETRKIEEFLEEGAYKFKKGDTFRFILRKNVQDHFSGSINHGLWFVDDDLFGQLVIKKISWSPGDNPNYIPTQIERIQARQEVCNAKVMHILGLGPRSDLTLADGGFYLVMERVPGINIKEILGIFASSFTKKRIEKILGNTFLTLEKARVAYAKKIVESHSLINYMRKIAMVLDRYNYHVMDFQIMILPAVGGGKWQINVIDTPQLRRYYHKAVPADGTAKHNIQNIIGQLEKLTH